MASALQLSTNVIDGLAVGCKAEFDFSNGADLKDYNFGSQYAFSKDVTLSGVTSKGRSKAALSVCHKLSGSDSYAVGLDMDLATYASGMCVGVEKKVCAFSFMFYISHTPNSQAFFVSTPQHLRLITAPL